MILATVDSVQALLPWQSGIRWWMFLHPHHPSNLVSQTGSFVFFARRTLKQVWNVQPDPSKHLLLVVATNHRQREHLVRGSRICKRGGHKILDLMSLLPHIYKINKTTRWEVVKNSASPKRLFFFRLHVFLFL